MEDRKDEPPLPDEGTAPPNSNLFLSRHPQSAILHPRPPRSLPRLVLFPGLGVDARLYEMQRHVASIEVPPWLKPEPDESLENYSRRMAATVRSKPPYFIGGVSIGAMIALEAARYLPAEGVFVISGCETYRSLPLWLRAFCKLAEVTPIAFFRPLYRLTPVVLRILGENLRWRHVQLIETMFTEGDPHLVKWGLPALAKWTLGQLPSVPIYRIHGKDDHVIPGANVESDVAIPGGGHLINLSHALAVNRFLMRHCRDRLHFP